MPGMSPHALQPHDWCEAHLATLLKAPPEDQQGVPALYHPLERSEKLQLLGREQGWGTQQIREPPAHCPHAS